MRGNHLKIAEKEKQVLGHIRKEVQILSGKATEVLVLDKMVICS